MTEKADAEENLEDMMEVGRRTTTGLQGWYMDVALLFQDVFTCVAAGGEEN